MVTKIFPLEKKRRDEIDLDYLRVFFQIKQQLVPLLTTSSSVCWNEKWHQCHLGKQEINHCWVPQPTLQNHHRIYWILSKGTKWWSIDSSLRLDLKSSMCHHDFMKLFIWSFSCGIGNHQKSPPGLSIISKLSNVKLPPIILPHLSLSWTTISWGIWQWPASFVGSPLQRALTTTLVVDGRKWCKRGDPKKDCQVWPKWSWNH